MNRTLLTNRQAVRSAVESLTYSRGFGKNMADAFRYVTQSMFTPAAGDRPNVPNIVSQAYSSLIAIFAQSFGNYKTISVGSTESL